MGRLHHLPTIGPRGGGGRRGEGAFVITNRQMYVRAVLNLYTQMPGTLVRVPRSDRALADHFFDRQIPIDIVEAALLLGSARRMFRCGPDLPAIRSLHYFQPIVEELLAEPLPLAYLGYLRLKVRPTTKVHPHVSPHREP